MKMDIAAKIEEYIWTRYLPESTYKTYVFIGYLKKSNLNVDYKEELEKMDLGETLTIDKVVEEKKAVLKKLNIEYPENRSDDVELLKKFKLIKETQSKDGLCKYEHVEEILKPEEVLNFGEEELENLENIKFEKEHDNAINMVLSLILTNNRVLDCSVEHITNMTKVKIAEVRTVLEFLVNNEKSINVQADKEISKLRKHDRIRITVNDGVFDEKRLVI